MKKNLLVLCGLFLGVNSIQSQCVPTCSSYAMSSIAFTTFPMTGTDAIPLFAPNADDGYSPPIDIGFTFNFYCNNTNSVIICSNGFLTFDIFQPLNPGTSQTAQFLPNSGTPNAIACLNFDDLDPSPSGFGAVTYTTIGTSPNKKFVLTYSNVPIWANLTSLNTGQIVLYETTNIIEIYTGLVYNISPYSGTQGIEDAAGSVGIGVPGRNQAVWSATNSAVQFSPYTPMPPSSITGNTVLCQGAQGVYLAGAAVGASSYNWSFPPGWTGSSTTTAVNATVGASGNVSVAATYTCGTSAATTLSVTSIPAPMVNITSATPNVICSGKTFTMNASGAVNYSVEPGGITGTPPFVIQANASTIYSLSGNNSTGCVSFNTATTSIFVNETPTVSVNSGSICLGQGFTITPSGAPSYVVSGGFFQVTPSNVGVTSYSVTGTSSVGCVSDPAVSQVTTVAVPNVMAISTKNTICAKESATLTANGATSYSWSTSATTSSIVVTLTASATYTVYGSTNGCSNYTTFTQAVSPCVGVYEADPNSILLSVYPNPNNGHFNIQIDKLQGQSQLELINALGEVVLEQELLTEQHQVSLTHVSSGIYYLKVRSNGQQQVIKIIVEN